MPDTLAIPASRQPGWRLIYVALTLALTPTSTSAAGDIEAGRTKAQRECSVCHGLEGVAKRPDVPNIGGESDIYLEIQIDAFRSGERKHEEMSIIAAGLSEEDVADVVAWYSSLRFEIALPDTP